MKKKPQPQGPTPQLSLFGGDDNAPDAVAQTATVTTIEQPVASLASPAAFAAPVATVQTIAAASPASAARASNTAAVSTNEALATLADLGPDTHTDTHITTLAHAMHSRILQWAQQRGGTAAHAKVAADAAARLVLAQHEGHVCIVIHDANERAALKASTVVAASVEARLPLVLDTLGGAHRLYLHRVLDDECAVAQRLRAACKVPLPKPSPQVMARLHALFPKRPDPASTDDGPDHQALAAERALTAPVLVVSGGPGTGKTTTLARILDLVLRQAPATRVMLAAPTGKAAARMTAALAAARAANPSLVLQSPAQPIPLRARTVHAWLGVHPRTGRARHHAGNPLQADLLVLDEASMLDLELARLLLDALPAQARLIMLGDKDQLAAVQSGAVFADLAAASDAGDDVAARKAVATAAGTPAATPAVVHLTRNYRFGAASGIADLAQHVRDGQVDAALGALRTATAASGIEWRTTGTDHRDPAFTAWRAQHLHTRLAPYIDALLQLQALTPAIENSNSSSDSDSDRADDTEAITQALVALDGWRLLCAVHDGPSGTRAWNTLAAVRVRASLPRTEHGVWFTGRAVMVTRNDNTLGLVNGDVGLVLPPQREARVATNPNAGDGDSPDNTLRMVAFLRADGSVLRWPAARLPTVETAFATSVHKAQGSEFERVTLVLPSPWQRPCTRELVYTGITRARSQVTVVADEASLRASIAARTERLGGLRARLRG